VMSAAVHASIRSITSASTIPGEPPTDSPSHTGALKLHTVFTVTANNSSASNIGENQSSLRDLIRHHTKEKTSHKHHPFPPESYNRPATRSHPPKPNRIHLTKKHHKTIQTTKPNPRTELRDQKPAMQGTRRLHSPESKPATMELLAGAVELKKPPQPGIFIGDARIMAASTSRSKQKLNRRSDYPTSLPEEEELQRVELFPEQNPNPDPPACPREATKRSTPHEDLNKMRRKGATGAGTRSDAPPDAGAALQASLSFVSLFRALLFLLTLQNQRTPRRYEIMTDCEKAERFVYMSCVDEVRYSFVSHLFDALRRNGISSVFVDSGDLLSDEAQEKVERARVSVVVLPANRQVCLEKLEKVLNCQRNKEQVVIPVLYGDSILHGEWLSAMNLRGLSPVFQSRNDCSDSKLVEKIVRNVNEKLLYMGRIGMSWKLREIENMVNKQPLGIRGVGIWGMPGIGKTELAKAVFDQVSGGFDACCFIEDYDKAFHENRLFRILVEQLMKDQPANSGSITKKRLRRDKLMNKRVLVVLDDVRNPLLAESFLEYFEWFGPESLIIITSRDKQVFRLCRINQIYEVQGLTEKEALQLFLLCASLNDMGEQSLHEVAMEVIKYAHGNPLALSIYGGALKGKETPKDMETAFLELKDPPSLERIDLQGCTNLQIFPPSGQLLHLRVVNLSGCAEIKNFPDVPPNIEKLHLQGTSIRSLPPSLVKPNRGELVNLLAELSGLSDALKLERLSSLEKSSSSSTDVGKLSCLELKNCSSLQSLPNMFHLEFLKVLDLSGCSELEIIQGFPQNLKELYLTGTAVREVPQLPQSLELLNAYGCASLESIRLDSTQLPMHYSFSNCFKLSPQVVNQFLVKALANAKHIPREHPQEFDKDLAFSFCAPTHPDQDSTIDLQPGSSVMIWLTPSWRSALVGFVMQVEVAFSKDYYPATGFGIKCICRWKNKEGGSHRIEKNLHCWAPGKAVLQDHMLVFCDVKMRPRTDEGNDPYILADLVVFEFYPVDNQSIRLDYSFTVERCGVYVITAATGNTSLESISPVLSLDPVELSDDETKDGASYDPTGNASLENISSALTFDSMDISCNPSEELIKASYDDLQEIDRALFRCVAYLFNDEDIHLVKVEPLVACIDLNAQGPSQKASPTCIFQWGNQDATNGDNEADMAETIANDVSSKLNITESEGFGEFVRIENHVSKLNILLSLESEEVRMVGIWGPSGIGKTDIARALYSRLAHRFQRTIFVDMSFVYRRPDYYGAKVDFQTQFLSEVLGRELKSLAEKSFIHITENGYITMHHLQQNFGREIVRNESIYSPGKRQFLVDSEDILDVFQDNTGTESVLGISLDISELDRELYISERGFSGMTNLRFLKFYTNLGNKEVNVHLPHGLDYLCPKLRLLHWEAFPMRCMPSHFFPENLVVLAMEASKLEKLWNEAQPLRSLKCMSLRCSLNLREIPDLSHATSLEKLDLRGCSSLTELPSSIWNLHKLKDLDMGYCTHLMTLPTGINLESLHCLNLSGCSRLTDFPEISRSISDLYLDGTAIEEVPWWIENISRLSHLSMNGCNKLNKISPNISKLKFLVEVDFSNCESLTEDSWQNHPEEISTSVTTVNMSGNSFQRLPDTWTSIQPEDLIFHSCRNLVSLPTLPTSLFRLTANNCESLESLHGSFSYPQAAFQFINCFKLNHHARELILQSDCAYAILPGEELPAHFTHRAAGSVLTIYLPRSSLSKRFPSFKACIMIESRSGSFHFGLVWPFKGGSDKIYYSCCLTNTPSTRNHLIVFHCEFSSDDVNDSRAELNYSDVQFEFDCLDDKKEMIQIKECGIQLLEVSPSADESGKIFKPESGYDSEESDVEDIGSCKRIHQMNNNRLGFRFSPTQEELINFYLKNKNLGKEWIVEEAISEININSYEPKLLPSLSKIKSNDLVWYFFSPYEYTNKTRKRTTSNGVWKLTGPERKIKDKGGIGGEIGIVKTLVYHERKPSSGGWTPWVMHEYHITCLPPDQGEARDFPSGNNEVGIIPSDFPSAGNYSSDLCYSFVGDSNSVGATSLTKMKKRQQKLPSVQTPVVDSNTVRAANFSKMYRLLQNLPSVEIQGKFNSDTAP
ncbi:hypothetical protein HID58_086306, partial [Brassica napus]